jgi:hypothetical protein
LLRTKLIHTEPKPGSDRGSALLAFAWVLWIILALAVARKSFVIPTIHTVFPKFAAGAERWWAGEPLYLEGDELGSFRYSPTFAILMTPFAALGLRLGATVWAWVSIGVFIWGLRRLICDVLPGAWPPARQGALLLLTLFGCIRGIWNGQSNAIVAGLLMAGAAFTVTHRFWQAAAVFTLAVCLKLSPLAVALLFVALWPRPLTARFAVMLGLAAILPFATQPPARVIEEYHAWFTHLQSTSAHRWPSFRDAWTLCELLGGPVRVELYRLLQAAAGLLTLGWCLWQQRRIADPRLLATLVLSAGAAYLMLFGPAVEFATYAILAPMTAWGFLEAGDRRRDRPLMLAAFLLTTVLGFGAVERSLAPAFPLAPAILPTGTLLFAIWLARYAHRAVGNLATVQHRSLPT